MKLISSGTIVVTVFARFAAAGDRVAADKIEDELLHVLAQGLRRGLKTTGAECPRAVSEVEEVHQVVDRAAVGRRVGVAGARDRVGQVVTATATDRR